jgi:hypothetical protein
METKGSNATEEIVDKIVPENKKPGTFLDRLRARLDEFAHVTLDEIAEVDAITVCLVYNQALGDNVDPSAMLYQRNADDPMTRARIAHAVGQMAMITTNRVAAGFQEALVTLRTLEQEIDVRRKTAEASPEQSQTAD